MRESQLLTAISYFPVNQVFLGLSIKGSYRVTLTLLQYHYQLIPEPVVVLYPVNGVDSGIVLC